MRGSATDRIKGRSGTEMLGMSPPPDEPVMKPFVGVIRADLTLGYSSVATCMSLVLGEPCAVGSVVTVYTSVSNLPSNIMCSRTVLSSACWVATSLEPRSTRVRVYIKRVSERRHTGIIVRVLI